MKTKRMKRTTEIVIEKEEAFVVGRLRRQVFARCPQCAAETRLVTPEEAAPVAHVTARMIYRRGEAGEVHFTETAEGRLLVCLNSGFEKG